MLKVQVDRQRMELPRDGRTLALRFATCTRGRKFVISCDGGHAASLVARKPPSSSGWDPSDPLHWSKTYDREERRNVERPENGDGLGNEI